MSVVPPCPEGNLYTIQPGDTFFRLAQRFRVSVDDIREANPGVDPNNLQIGQVICIPLAVPPVFCPPGTFTYTIRPGDTYFRLSRRFGVSIEDLIAVNPGVEPDAVLIGQQICIPAVEGIPPGACPAGTTSYIVRPGDTFFTLARRFGTTVAAIQQANPFVDPQNLRIGQLLCIPVQ